MEFKILISELLDKYREVLTESPLEKLDKIKVGSKNSFFHFDS